MSIQFYSIQYRLRGQYNFANHQYASSSSSNSVATHYKYKQNLCNSTYTKVSKIYSQVNREGNGRIFFNLYSTVSYTYFERLKALKFYLLDRRRLQGDRIEVYKCVMDMDKTVAPVLTL